MICHPQNLENQTSQFFKKFIDDFMETTSHISSMVGLECVQFLDFENFTKNFNLITSHLVDASVQKQAHVKVADNARVGERKVKCGEIKQY